MSVSCFYFYFPPWSILRIASRKRSTAPRMEVNRSMVGRKVTASEKVLQLECWSVAQRMHGSYDTGWPGSTAKTVVQHGTWAPGPRRIEPIVAPTRVSEHHRSVGLNIDFH